MHTYKLNTNPIYELFVLKANSKTHSELVDYLKSIRMKFIDLCKTRNDWSTTYLTNENQSISGDIFNEIDLPGGHIMFYVLSDRFVQFPDLQKELLRIIGGTRRFENWED